MALIKCPECNKEVSDTAAACPGCGAPISKESQASGVPVTTVQETSKKFKVHQIFSTLLIIIGISWLIIASSGEPSPISTLIAFLLTFGGFTWFIVTRFRIWWHHK